MIIGVPREEQAAEHRVGLLPSAAYQLTQRVVAVAGRLLFRLVGILRSVREWLFATGARVHSCSNGAGRASISRGMRFESDPGCPAFSIFCSRVATYFHVRVPSA